jgi:4,5-DOPA dioxygenase extradiol
MALSRTPTSLTEAAMTVRANADRMPALFLAHGNPMNVLADNAFTHSLTTLAADLPRPKAVLVVSAHWQTRGTRVLSSAKPRTIHDFGGFPAELYEVQYPAAGSPELAARVCELIPQAHADDEWGLDHGSWTILRHMWPDADVPVFELSLDATAPAQAHWELGERLAPLRDAGVLVVGSGNIVHSFAGISWDPDAPARPWAEEFDAWIADAALRRDRDALVNYESAGAIARLSVPTNEHYLPLLYAAAMSHADDTVEFTHAGIEMGSMSMRCVRFG